MPPAYCRHPPAYISRIGNRTVLQKAGCAPFSEQILRRQLVLLGKAALPSSPIRHDVFADGTLHPQIGRYVRRVGRPRKDWLGEVWKAGALKFGGESQMRQLLLEQGNGADNKWKAEVDRTFNV